MRAHSVSGKRILKNQHSPDGVMKNTLQSSLSEQNCAFAMIFYQGKP